MEIQFSLTYSSSNTYMYDRNGNRLEEIRDMDNELDETLLREASGTLVHDISPTSNRLLGVDKGSSPISDLTYDDIGNVAVISRTINGVQVQQDFTYGNALVPMLPTEIHQHAQFESDDPNQELEVIETFSYDFSGARISRTLTVYEMPEGSSEPDEVVTTTYYLPSGTENLAELDQYGRVSRAYQFAGGERIGYKSKRIHARYVKDHLGSTRQTIALNLWKTQDPMNVPQSAAGDRSLNQAMRYAQADSGPFGLSTREAANSGANFEPHRFTGQELEPQIGLYYMGARFYDPDLGRFLQVDPAREFWNSYSYVGNNPVMGTDSSGMMNDFKFDLQMHSKNPMYPSVNESHLYADQAAHLMANMPMVLLNAYSLTVHYTVRPHMYDEQRAQASHVIKGLVFDYSVGIKANFKLTNSIGETVLDIGGTLKIPTLSTWDLVKGARIHFGEEIVTGVVEGSLPTSVAQNRVAKFLGVGPNVTLPYAVLSAQANAVDRIKQINQMGVGVDIDSETGILYLSIDKEMSTEEFNNAIQTIFSE